MSYSQQPGFQPPPPPGASTPTERRAPSPHWSLLNLILPGAGQVVFGQVVKGFLIIAVNILTFPTFWGPLVVMLLAIIDGYKVGNKRRRTGSVGDWEFFPD